MNLMPQITIIEDDASIRKLVCYALDNDGYRTEGYSNGADFFANTATPDLVILDVMLPDMDGIDILKRLREQPRTQNVPVMMLTAKGSEYDKVHALDLGADDYLTKPFGVMELLARVNALLRRSRSACQEMPNGAYVVNGIALDEARREVTAAGAMVPLAYKEFELLRYLMLNRGIVLSRDKIMQAVWGFDFEGESRTVDMHIRLLRQKLGQAGEAIQTIRGVGYKIDEVTST